MKKNKNVTCTSVGTRKYTGFPERKMIVLALSNREKTLSFGDAQVALGRQDLDIFELCSFPLTYRGPNGDIEVSVSFFFVYSPVAAWLPMGLLRLIPALWLA